MKRLALPPFLALVFLVPLLFAILVSTQRDATVPEGENVRTLPPRRYG